MIHGLVVVNKEKGLSSHAVVARLRIIFGIKKVGHFGTLDPAATGILLAGLGQATRFFDYYSKKEKVYSGIIRFGYATSTYDAEGKPLSEKKPIDLHRLQGLEEILARFVGPQQQLPPPYSAKKHKGRPLYAYARSNREVELKPNRIEIYRLETQIVDRDALHFEAVTSSGTYIRSLAHDIGQQVGVGAFLEELRRDRIGQFTERDAFTLEEIRQHVEDDQLAKVVHPIEILLDEFPKLIVSPEGRRFITNGLAVQKNQVQKIFPAASNEFFRLFDDKGQLLAIARRDDDSQTFKPHIVFPEET